MDADPAARADVTGATASEDGAAAPDTQNQPTIAPPSPDRLKAILAAGGDGALGEQVGAEPPNAGEQNNGNKADDTNPNGNGASSQDGTGRPDEGSTKTGNGKTEQPKAAGKTTEDADEKPLTEEQRKVWPPESLERIHKLTAKRKADQAARETAERERDELKQKLQSRQPVQVQPTRQDPLADVNDERQLEAEEAELRRGLEWALKNPDGANDVPVGKDKDGEQVLRDFSREEMIDQRLFYEEALRQHVPARREYLARRTIADETVAAAYPDLVKDDSEDAQELQQMLQILPELTRLPAHKLVIAWAIEGRKAFQARQAAAEEAAGKGGAGKGGKESEARPEVKPFLQKQPPRAPGVPQARGASAADPARGGDSKELQQARERVRDGNARESDEVALIRGIRNKQAANRNAVAV